MTAPATISRSELHARTKPGYAHAAINPTAQLTIVSQTNAWSGCENPAVPTQEYAPVEILACARPPDAQP
jgi:hypothetical protein